MKLGNKIPALFVRHGFEKFARYLGTWGVKEISVVEHGRKVYGTFDVPQTVVQ